MDFRILGPLEVVEDGRELPIRGRKLRALLALLLVHANEVVSRERLIEELWGEQPPPNASKTVQVHVSRLRRELGDVIVTRGGGYLLQVEPGSLDRLRFEELIEEGRRALAEGAPEGAEKILGDALALWRGAPLADLDEESFARIESDRLAELHLEAAEERIEARLALGRPAEAIGELEPIVARHPFRERPRAQLMLALYRAGRQAEALATYRRAREELVEELGIEPGPRLRELHDAILAQDPALDGPRPAPAARAPEQPGPPATAGKNRRRSALPALALAATLAAAAVLLVVVLAGGTDDSAAPLTDDSHAIAVIDPATNEVTTAASVGTNPGPLAYEPESRSLWVANLDDESVTRIHLRPLRTGRTIPIGQPPAGLAAGGGAVWVAGASRTAPFVTARRIDPRFDTAGRPVRVESFPEGRASIALGPNALWVAPEFGRLTRLDPGTGRASGAGIDAGQSATAVAADRHAVWTADGPGGVISRIDPSTGAPQPFPVAGGPADIAIGAGAVWVSAALDDSVARIDPDSVSVRRTIPVGRRPAGVAVGAGAVWVANSGDGTVSRIDPRLGRVTDTIPVGGSPTDVAVADGRVWVSVRPLRPVGRGTTRGILRAETPADLDSLDPALAYQSLSFQIEYATCAKLTNYPDEEGTAGGRVAPELAESLPAPTDGGRRYTFRIRAGFRFSPPSGERVTARTLKYSIERGLDPSMRGPAAAFMSDLIGASAYASGRARHVAGITATGNTLTLRLARPSSTLLARLSLPFFCAVPVGTPIDPDGLRTVPSAGPYYVSSNVAGEEMVLRRNPHYGGSRPHRLEEVRITTGAGAAGTLARVETGEIDYALFFGDARRARRLEARYGSGGSKAESPRYFVHPGLELDMLIFNTSRAPFSSARLRRAVSLAIDRRALARASLFNGLPASPTDQYLPPGMPGFQDARVYPYSPDLAKARELAGPQRRVVVLYVLPEHMRFAEIVKANLRRIGMDVQIRAQASHFPQIRRRGEPFDLAVAYWESDYPDPIDFLGLLDGRTIRPDLNLNTAYFDDPRYNRKLDAAAALPSPARELALGRLDVEVTRRSAPWAAVSNQSAHDFFSERIGCQVYNPVYGMDLAALCVRPAP